MPETGRCFEFKRSLVIPISKMNSYILKQNINYIMYYFVLLSLGKNSLGVGKSEPLTYVRRKLIKDIIYLQSLELKNKRN